MSWKEASSVSLSVNHWQERDTNGSSGIVWSSRAKWLLNVFKFKIKQISSSLFQVSGHVQDKF